MRVASLCVYRWGGEWVKGGTPGGRGEGPYLPFLYGGPLSYDPLYGHHKGVWTRAGPWAGQLASRSGDCCGSVDRVLGEKEWCVKKKWYLLRTPEVSP